VDKSLRSRYSYLACLAYLAYLAAVSKHSKWAKIKRKKGVADAKKGAAFTKLLSAITVAVREGGGADPSGNFKLRLAVDAARAENVPKENIERAISRGAGKGEGAQLESLLYEGYGPGGAAVLVDALTDNRNRTVNELKHAFAEYGGTLGSSGCVAWAFTRKGVLRNDVPTGGALSPEAELALIEAGVEDIRAEDGSLIITTDIANLETVRNAALQNELTNIEAGLEWIPTTPAPALAPADEERLAELLAALEEREDVVAVATNATFE
jgi:YebC/PmpR family DNA-binding regulatory protein